MIRTENLTKRFGQRTAVADLCLEVAPGQVFGFLGPNGAGKTTTIRMILGLIRPTSGQVWLLGQPAHEQPTKERRRIGVMGEHQYLYEDMSAAEYLAFFADLYRVFDGRRRTGDVLERVGLSDRASDRLGAFSRGMRQKLALARALLPDPDLLILDEPTAGLDPTGIRDVRAIIQDEQARGKTVFLSSHILSEIEQTADSLGILHNGRLVAHGSMSQLRHMVRGSASLEVELATPVPALLPALESMPGVHKVIARDNLRVLHINADAHRDSRLLIGQRIFEAGGVVLSMCWHEVSLEEAFLTITESNVRTLAGCEAVASP